MTRFFTRVVKENPHFLIVEDSIHDTEFICRWLDSNFRKPKFTCVTKGSEALNEFKHNKFKAVFVNLKLGHNRIAGIDVIKSIRRQSIDIPVFVITGMEDPRYRDMALEAGATGFFTKDLEEADAIAVLNLIALHLASIQKGERMKSWRTTISGACTATGMAMFGGPVALSTVKFEVPSEMQAVCIWGGLCLTLAGIFFSNLFAADKKELHDHLNTCKQTKTNE